MRVSRITIPIAIALTLLAALLPARSRAAESVRAEAWFPAVVSLRIGVVHGQRDSLFTVGGSLAYQGGAIRDGQGWFWTVGLSGAWVSGVVQNAPDDCHGRGFIAGPEARVGYAWGDWRRDVFLYLRAQPYAMWMRSDRHGAFLGPGARVAIGVGYEQGLFKYWGSPAYGFPNLLELVVDLTGGGPLMPSFRAGIALGWEF